MAPQFLMLLAAEGGGGGLTDIDAGLFWWTIVLFAIFATLLYKLAWGPLLGVIESREKSVREQVEGAQKANAEAAALLEKHKELVHQAGQERDDILKRTQAEAERIKAELQQKARAEADQIVERARQQIGAERDAAITELRKQVADVAMEAAAKIVESSLTKEAQKKIVDDYIAALEASRRQARS
jgi:F-type H+-transporting ATPase subunit b